MSWLQSWLHQTLHTELTLYTVKGDNLIQVVGQYPNIQRQNVGSFTNKGVEFSAHYTVSKQWMWHANYSYLDLSTPLIAAPRQQANIGTDYHFKNWTFNLNAQYIEKLYTALSPLTLQDDYLLLNLRVACRPIKNLQVFATARNLLNSQYQINYGYPMPGINFHVGLGYSF